MKCPVCGNELEKIKDSDWLYCPECDWKDDDLEDDDFDTDDDQWQEDDYYETWDE